MNPMWNEAVLQRLRVAAGNRNPAEARLAVRQHYLGFFPRWRGDAVLTCWMVPLGLLFLCLGLVAPPEFPLSISTGFTAQNSYFAACAFALMLAQVCRETWHVPEILAMAPISPEALGRIAHRQHPAIGLGGQRLAPPAGDTAARALDHRDQGGPVPDLHGAFGHHIDQAEGE
jgi:hypothetical protein